MLSMIAFCTAKCSQPHSGAAGPAKRWVQGVSTGRASLLLRLGGPPVQGTPLLPGGPVSPGPHPHPPPSEDEEPLSLNAFFQPAHLLCP